MNDLLGKNTQSLAIELRSVRSHGPYIGPAKGLIPTPGSDQRTKGLTPGTTRTWEKSLESIWITRVE
jgi:hypothetical protein